MPTRVILEPLDGDSEFHIQRMHDMVAEMGWSQSTTTSIIQAHREGRRALFWIAIDPQDPNYETEMDKARSVSDMYSQPLISRKARLGNDSENQSQELQSSASTTLTEFVPIGDIGLNITPLDPQPKDAATVGKSITVAGFYVTRSLQGTGIGTAALNALAEVAKGPPLLAKALVLYCLSKETEDLEGLYKSIDRPPQDSKQDFYAKRGFQIYDMVFTPEYKLDTGGTWPMKWAYMRKMLTDEKTGSD